METRSLEIRWTSVVRFRGFLFSSGPFVSSWGPLNKWGSWWINDSCWYWNQRFMKSLFSSFEASIVPLALSSCWILISDLPNRNTETFSFTFDQIACLSVFLSFVRNSLIVSTYGSFLNSSHLFRQNSFKSSRACRFLNLEETSWSVVSALMCTICRNSMVQSLSRLKKKVVLHFFRLVLEWSDVL